MKPVEELSGREMDAAVAEEVMDGTLFARCVVEGHHVDHVRPEWWRGRCHDCDISLRDAPLVPKEYSTDISAAWEVVEKMGDDWSCDVSNNDEPGPDWWCAFGHGSTYEEATAPTAPEAICRAALKAVRITAENPKSDPESPCSSPEQEASE